MKSGLESVYRRTVEILAADPRVVAAYMTGSVGTEREDAYSDVDPMFLVRAEEFDAVDADLPDVFRQAGVKPVLWWPERINNETLRNYAVLFEQDGELLQYDITICAVEENAKVPVRRDQVIFDKATVHEVAEPSPQAQYSPVRLRWTIEMYWLYVYIHGKYLKRGDRFKLIAAQHELMHCHLEVLRATRPEVAYDWWPIMAKQVCQGDAQDTCLSYLGSADVQGVCRALPKQMKEFSQDAHVACEKWGIEYPEDFEARAVRYVQTAMEGVTG